MRLTRLQPTLPIDAVQSRLHAAVYHGEPGHEPHHPPLQQCYAGPVELREQHHGTHNEPVRCTVFSVDNTGEQLSQTGQSNFIYVNNTQ